MTQVGRSQHVLLSTKPLTLEVPCSSVDWDFAEFFFKDFGLFVFGKIEN